MVDVFEEMAVHLLIDAIQHAIGTNRQRNLACGDAAGKKKRENHERCEQTLRHRRESFEGCTPGAVK